MQRRAVIAAILATPLLSCGTSAPAPQTKILDAGQCWFQIERCHDVQVHDGRIVPVCRSEWEARCREADLERYLRERCSIVRLPDPRKVAVACGSPK